MFPFTTDFGTPQRSPFAFGAGMDGTTGGTPPTTGGLPPKPVPTKPVQPSAPGGFDMNTFLQFLMGQMGHNQAQPPPINLGAQLAGVKQAQDPQGQANKGYIPGVNNQYNPFSNGFFNSY